MTKYNIHSVIVDIDDGILNDILRDRLVRQTWESDEAGAVKLIEKESCVLELGACIGVVSTLINKRISNPSNQVVVEANPRLIQQLNKVKQDNDCGFYVVNGFLSTKSETKDFSIHPNHIMGGRIGKANGREHVKCKSVTMRQLEEKFLLKFDTIVMDIEGGEYELYQNGFFEKNNLKNIKSMMIEFHNHKNKNIVRRHLMKTFSEQTIKVHKNNNGVYFYYKK